MWYDYIDKDSCQYIQFLKPEGASATSLTRYVFSLRHLLLVFYLGSYSTVNLLVNSISTVWRDDDLHDLKLKAYDTTLGSINILGPHSQFPIMERFTTDVLQYSIRAVSVCQVEYSCICHIYGNMIYQQDWSSINNLSLKQTYMHMAVSLHCNGI